MTMRTALTALTIMLGACVEGAPPVVPPAPALLMGTHWTMEGGGVSAPTMQFSENRASGNGGCNSWFSQVDNSGAALSFTSVGSTRRMCEPGVMTAERAFFGALERTQSARIEGDTLILQDAGGGDLARFDRVR